jgi:hypothetical protein
MARRSLLSQKWCNDWAARIDGKPQWARKASIPIAALPVYQRLGDLRARAIVISKIADIIFDR